MPVLKEVQSLKELCLGDFAKRLVYHGECFQRSEESGRTHKFYKRIQRFFTDIIVVKFSNVLGRKDLQSDKTKEFLSNFCDEKTGNASDWPCLEFLFNEYTTCITPLFCTQHEFHEEIFTYISSKCKNLRIFNLTSENMLGGDVCKVISQFQYLEYVDLVDLPSPTDFLTILDMCPLITNLSISDSLLPDDLFLSLCKHHSQSDKSDKFQFCPESGNCSTAGKNLQVLHCDYYSIHDRGRPYSNYIATGLPCALQHFPKLKSFPDQNSAFPRQPKSMPIAILTLQDSAQENGKPFIHLELTGLTLFRNVCIYLEPLQLRRISLSCPKLEYLQVEKVFYSPDFLTSTFKNIKKLLLIGGSYCTPYTPEVKHLLAAHGTKFTALRIHTLSSIDVNHINDMLGACCNLKELSLRCNMLTGQFLDHTKKMLSAASSLEKIYLHCMQESNERSSFLYELFCSAKSLKSVTLGPETVTNEFFFAMDKNDFSCLEELCISHSVLGESFLYTNLMTQKNSLRKISLLRCSCIKRLNMFIQQNNYDLEIDHPSEMFIL